MADQNWALIGHLKQDAWTNQMSVSGINSFTVTDDAGNNQTTADSIFPQIRIVGKLYFNTTVSEMSATDCYAYFYSTGGFDEYYCYTPASNTIYSTGWNAAYGSYTTGGNISNSQWGKGMKTPQYTSAGSWNWGSDVTDIDGNTVTSSNARRGVWNNFVVDAYYQNQNRSQCFKTIMSSASNGNSSSTTDTGEQYNGLFYYGGAGTYSHYNMSSFIVYSAYTMRGEIMVYRAGLSNYVGGS